MVRKTSSNYRLKMEISEVMTSTIYSLYPDQTVAEAAIKMAENKVGSIIIQPRKGQKKPLGIITERDIVTRVVALGKDPTKTAVDEIASKPVVTVPPTIDIVKAMSLMAKLNIRRLVVIENNNVVGICTYRDLLRVAPGLLEIASEYEKIGFGKEDNEHEIIDFINEDYDKDTKLNNSDIALGFYCSSCGQWIEGSPVNEGDDHPLCKECFSLEENDE